LVPLFEQIIGTLHSISNAFKLTWYNSSLFASLIGAIGGTIVAFILVWWKERYKKPHLINPENKYHIKVFAENKYFICKGRLQNQNSYPVTYLVYTQIDKQESSRVKYTKLSEIEKRDHLDGWTDEPMIVNRCDIYEFAVVIPWNISEKKLPEKITVTFEDYRRKKVGSLRYISFVNN